MSTIFINNDYYKSKITRHYNKTLQQHTQTHKAKEKVNKEKQPQ